MWNNSRRFAPPDAGIATSPSGSMTAMPCPVLRPLRKNSTRKHNYPLPSSSRHAIGAPPTARRFFSEPRRSTAQVAQLVEHATENRSVGGSIPPLGTTPLSLVTDGASRVPVGYFRGTDGGQCPTFLRDCANLPRVPMRLSFEPDQGSTLSGKQPSPA